MARPENVAVAGYVPTPAEQIRRIARLLSVSPPRDQRDRCSISLADPCAGEGHAISDLVVHLSTKNINIYTCEMEATRHAALKAKLKEKTGFDNSSNTRCVKGDAFHLTWRGSVSLLWLNPPYDVDHEYGRLEERFLRRFTELLDPSGILVFLIPFYALRASARTLVEKYKNIRCFRFSGDDWSAYQQIAVLASRAEDSFSPSELAITQLVHWSGDYTVIEDLPEMGEPLYELKTNAWVHSWAMEELDISGLIRRHVPWHASSRGRKTPTPIRGFVPEQPLADLYAAVYDVATVPRPAHVAAGIAAGIFNGARIEPDAPESGLPPLLVKGVFDREWRKSEEKKDKDGNIVAVVEVQKPKLVVTTLNLESGEFLELANGSGENTVSALVSSYGRALASVMERQCRIAYDPRQPDGWVLPSLGRKLYAPQEHAVRACIRLLENKQTALLLGEVGVGKTTVAQTVAHAWGAKRILALCPPHLLDSWRDEVRSVLPDAGVVVLSTPSDVDRLAQSKAGQVVAVLSREAAKLGHALEAVPGACPRCGAPAPEENIVKRRSRCSVSYPEPIDLLARLARELAFAMRPFAPKDDTVCAILRRLPERGGAVDWTKPPNVLRRMLTRVDNTSLWIALLIAIDDAELILSAAAHESHNQKRGAESLIRDLALLLPPGSEEQRKCIRQGIALCRGFSSYWTQLETYIERLGGGETVSYVLPESVSWQGGKLSYGGNEAGSLEMALSVLRALASKGEWRYVGACGEPLYQSTPKPRRYPLADYIQKRYPRIFDFLIIDEAHEYSGDGSAQERAAHRLMALKLPTILMTGSIMNGYAESLFPNFWHASRAFREEFPEREGSRGTFVERYGYLKRELRDVDTESGQVVAFGSVTDRVERREKEVGKAPGIMPVFLFKHLLSCAVTLQIEDFALALPHCTEEPVDIAPSEYQLEQYRNMLEKVKSAITRDRFDPERSGKLFGALAELPSYLDLSFRQFEVRYPESVGGELVAAAEPTPSGQLLPKERWLVDTLRKELAAGYRCMVLAWHLELLPRLADVIETGLGEPVEVLYVSKVPTKKRQEWIDQKVVKKKRRILVCNPVGIQTGLNNLKYFNRIVWHENPACNPLTYRQAIGRIRRLGQSVATRSIFPRYTNTLQETLYRLLLHKVGVSQATDGLDPDAALRAIGAADDDFDASLSIGKYLYGVLSGGTT